MLSDREIEASVKPQNIVKIGAKLGLGEEALDTFGKLKAKVEPRLGSAPGANLILVTATNPTPYGEGKTTVTVGLSDGLARIGKRVCAALREPSLGPVFGIKGGATGGGYSQVTPSEDINLHFNGDFHAITSANNLIAAMLDNHIHHGNALNIDPARVVFKRCMDMNDRSLREIEIGLEKSNKFTRKDGFVITAASEIMAILCLATDLKNLKERAQNIIVAYDKEGGLVRAKSLNCADAVCVLLKEAIKPNLVQTLEGTPVLIHGGPFANIAHGCNSVIATKTALNLAGYVVTEAGFGAELGAQKFLDIKCRTAGLAPKCVVLVSTIRSLKYNGGCDKDGISQPNLDALKLGGENLKAHIENLKNFNQNVIVALNKFAADSDDEIAYVRALCKESGAEFSVCEGFLKGSVGTEDLAKKVAQICEKPAREINFTYDANDPVKTKIEKIATKIYGAKDVVFSPRAQEDLAEISRLGFEGLPVCVAKTQYSFSSDAKLLGRPKGFSFEVSALEIRGGAGFIVAVSGSTMLMPGLPKVPAAEQMRAE
ncbi:formate--tetrahydrofolate ligase [Campylobacter rectus RM3267]|uniref:Formate--tetrahydrofolate ligase n=2 Tax=Campylobacter rectus TaxID=203 RepID=A0A6G5QPJ5_CAMRE|nr:formate--tetrahydrofolate ligase [Campylobacter rectus]EEF15214.1 formate--tetrahydrofolate ligase [Campylobacter rectus RM3267]QCD47635.1 formate--tetrahydrofolate ligase [Campylobacter rectus]UEB48334.1 formate--tetrahydrofolate ligase [Campylobacter rectus]